MSAHLEDAARRSFQRQRKPELPFRKRDPLSHAQRRKQFACREIVFDFLEDPWMPEGRPRHHDTVNAVAVEGFFCQLRRSDIPVPDDRNMHARVVFHFPDQCPVGFSLVELAAGPAMDRDGPDAAVLQTFGQFYDDLGLVVPAEPGLDGDRFSHRFYDTAGDPGHLVRIPHHTGSRPPDRDLAHRTAEVDIDQIRPVSPDELAGLVCHFGGLNHRVFIAAVDLDADGSLFVGSHQFGVGLSRVADQSLGRDEFRVHQIRPLLATEHPEGRVRHVLHRRQQHRFFSQVYVSDLHIPGKFTIFARIIWKRT